MEYKIKSKCCNANVWPDGVKKQLYCGKCKEILGVQVYDNEKILVKEKNG